MANHLHAGTPPPPEALVDVSALIDAYYLRTPDPTDRAQRVAFRTSGHRGSPFDGGFNEAHVMAITQAICDYRRQHGIVGPLFIGRDPHALSEPAFATAVDVLGANRVHVMLQAGGGCTPTPAISRAIVVHNRSCPAALADGIIVTPSQKPPADGGVKYTPPNGGPADPNVTRWIEDRANGLLSANDWRVERMTCARSRRANTTHVYDYIGAYVRDLELAVDMDAIARSGLRVGADPLGGAAGCMWGPIAERYGLNIEVINETVDPTFRFTPLDWDGQIRMDCASPYAMATLIGLRDRFDISFGNNADADRHGIVTRGQGLMPSSTFLPTAAAYLFTHRPGWRLDAVVGKTVVSSGMVDRVARMVGRRVVEVPTGFKWFVPRLLDGSMGFAGDEGACATFLQRDGLTWTTDKDGIVMNLLAAELMAITGQDPSAFHDDVARDLGTAVYDRIDGPATPEQNAALAALSAADVGVWEIAGDPIMQLLNTVPGSTAPIGGLKVVTEHGWFAIRPSGTEPVFRLYAESFKGVSHLRRIQFEARALLDPILGGVPES